MRRMLKIITAILIGAALLAGLQHLRHSAGPGLTARPEGAGLRVASYNVHYIVLPWTSGRWSVAGWERRKHALDAAFKALDADIIAFQEMESFSWESDGGVNLAREWLLTENPAYAAAAVGDWREFPSTQPIFYRRDRFAPLDQGWFFFAETPDAIYSRTFNGGYPAFASWARLQDRAKGRTFRVVNVHFDYWSRSNRRRSAALVAERLRPWIAAGEAVLLLGDLNALNGSTIHRRLETAGLKIAPTRGATYHFDRGLNLFGAIDHIGYSPAFAPIGEPMALRRRFSEVWPSDHYPVAADLTFLE